MLFPIFNRRENGELVLQTKEPTSLEPWRSGRCQDPGQVLADARAATKRLGGDISSRVQVLGQARLQVGQYRGATFRWLVQNRLGYVAYLVDSTRLETATQSSLSRNKLLLSE